MSVLDVSRESRRVSGEGPGDAPRELPRGLHGVVVAETAIGDVRGDAGFFHYREYSAVDLARSRPFEDVWQLVLDGALPTSHGERDTFADDVARRRRLSPDLRSLVEVVARSGTAPLDGLRTVLSAIAGAYRMRPVVDIDEVQRRADALTLAALTPTIVTALRRRTAGLQPIAPRDDLGTAANLLWMLTGTEPHGDRVRAIEQYLVATIDHGFNASTFTARVVASTGADVAACAVAALGAMGGPLHGGAPSRALDLLDEIGTPERARDVVAGKVRRGERIMGFGHAVYRTEDPRSRLLRELAVGLGGPTVELALEVERCVVEVLAELKPGRDLYANVEFYAGVVMAACGVPRDMFTPTFACSRMVGWTANVLEQAREAKIIRPSARYVGPEPPVAVPSLSRSRDDG